jgi:hypothetical protein
MRNEELGIPLAHPEKTADYAGESDIETALFVGIASNTISGGLGVSVWRVHRPQLISSPGLLGVL